MFREMRRSNQQMTKQECIDFLKAQPRGVLAVNGENGYPYAVPLDFVYHEDNGRVYFHIAPEGHKLDAVLADQRVSFCVYGNQTQDEGAWWYHFDSVILFGRVRIIEDAQEKIPLLRKLGSKYMPDEKEREDLLSRSGARVLIMELTVDHMSGKHVEER